MKRIILFSLLMLSSFSHDLPSQQFLQRTNGLYGGRLDMLSVGDDGKLYTGYYRFYSSDDNGESWSKCYQNYSRENLRMYNMIVTGTNIIISANQYDVSGYGDYSLISNDAGKTWYDDTSFPRIDKYYKKDNGDFIIISGNRLYNLDSGSNKPILLDTVPFSATTIDYILTGSIIESKTGSIIICRNEYEPGLYKSMDKGKSWKIINFNKLTLNSISSDKSGNLYLCTKERGLLISMDDGDNWVQTSLDSSSVTSIVVDSKQNIYTGTNYGILKSIDNGKTWTESCKESMNALLCINKSDFIFFINGYEGVWRSTDYGENWEEKSNGIDNLYISSVIVNNKNELLAKSIGRGIYKSIDGGNSWENVLNSFDEYREEPEYGIFNQIAQFENSIFSNTSKGLYRSTDYGNTWKLNDNYKLPEWSSIKFYNKDTVYAASEYGIHCSYDGGSNWKILYSGNRLFPQSLLVDSDGNIYISAIIWKNKIRSGLFRSTNSGLSWDTIGTDLDSTYIINSILETKNGELICNILGHNYTSTNKGTSWIKNNTRGRGNYNFIDYWDNLYSCTTGGGTPPLNPVNAILYKSTDLGNTWEILDSAVKGVRINSLAFDKEGYVYAATCGGVFRSIRPTSIFEENYENQETYSSNEKISFNLFPNPGNKNINYLYNINRKSHVSINLYNNNGQFIKNIFEGIEYGGLISKSFNAENLPAGIYYLEIQSGYAKETKKIIILDE